MRAQIGCERKPKVLCRLAHEPQLLFSHRAGIRRFRSVAECGFAQGSILLPDGPTLLAVSANAGVYRPLGQIQTAAEGLKLVPASQGVEVEAALAFATAGQAARAESLAQDLNKRLSVGHPDAVALAARDSGAIGPGSEESAGNDSS